MKKESNFTIENVLLIIFITPFMLLAVYCMAVVWIVCYPILWVLIKLGIIDEDCKVTKPTIWKSDT